MNANVNPNGYVALTQSDRDKLVALKYQLGTQAAVGELLGVCGSGFHGWVHKGNRMTRSTRDRLRACELPDLFEVPEAEELPKQEPQKQPRLLQLLANAVQPGGAVAAGDPEALTRIEEKVDKLTEKLEAFVAEWGLA